MAVYVAAGTALAGGLVSAAGASKSAKAQRAAAEFNARVMERNAKVAKQEAEQQLFMNERDMLRFSRIATDFIKNQQAYYSGSGVVSGQDSALVVALESANNADEQIRNKTYDAEVAALGMREQATGLKLQAGLTRMEGAAKARATRIQGMASLLGSASKAAGMFV
tara:strand:+ start:1030 stop:1527 length:498 start_codon:yes stop_codon:yes gene_type:complete